MHDSQSSTNENAERLASFPDPRFWTGRTRVPYARARSNKCQAAGSTGPQVHDCFRVSDDTPGMCRARTRFYVRCIYQTEVRPEGAIPLEN